jgi:hypothetical protein
MQPEVATLDNDWLLTLVGRLLTLVSLRGGKVVVPWNKEASNGIAPVEAANKNKFVNIEGSWEVQGGSGKWQE